MRSFLILAFIGLLTNIRTNALAQNPRSTCFYSLDMLRDVEFGNWNPNNRSTTSRNIRAKAGTKNGEIADTRSIFQFDLSAFDSTQIVDSAFLYLYAAASSNGNNHGTEDGSNESYLRRVIQPWSDTSISWLNEPLTTATNEYFMPMTTDPWENREHMDVTDLVQDMVSNPSTSHGFHFQLATESFYRRMLFGSSDNADSTVHPKLHVYICPNNSSTGLHTEPSHSNLKAYFNADGALVLKSSSPLTRIRVVDALGQQVYDAMDINGYHWIANNWNAGYYFITAQDQHGVIESLGTAKVK